MALQLSRISPCLVFDHQAEQAARFYVSIFKNSKIIHMSHFAENEPGPAGSVRTVSFQLLGQKFMAANGGPHFTFSQGMSLYVSCNTQNEIDVLWDRLSRGGVKEYCGWVKDKFGLSWQIAPAILESMAEDPDLARAQRVMDAVFKMRKLDISVLKAAYGKSPTPKTPARKRAKTG